MASMSNGTAGVANPVYYAGYAAPVFNIPAPPTIPGMSMSMGNGAGVSGQSAPAYNLSAIPIQSTTMTFGGNNGSLSPTASGSMAGSPLYNFAGFTAGAGTSSAGVGGAANGGGTSLLQGFSFTPPPLVLNGQSVSGGLNFTAAQPVAQVDQATQAYNFINALNQQAYGFEGNAINIATANASATNSQVIGLEGTFGAGEVSALNTLASAEQTAASKLSSGCSGLGCLF